MRIIFFTRRRRQFSTTGQAHLHSFSEGGNFKLEISHIFTRGDLHPLDLNLSSLFRDVVIERMDARKRQNFRPGNRMCFNSKIRNIHMHM